MPPPTPPQPSNFSPTAAPIPPAPPLPPTPPLRIYALDDDEDFRQYLEAILAAEGHEITAVATPEELYALIDPHGTTTSALPTPSGFAGLSASASPSISAGSPAGAGGVNESAMPDLVLLDINMGRTRGEAVLAELRRRWPKLCVIVVTGYPSMDSMRQTFKHDAFDYLAKPFSIDELKRVLSQAASSLGLGQRPHDRLRMELGRQIRLARTERAWTLKDLSERSGISVSQLSSIERGTHLPSLESLVDIASALGKPPSAWMIAAGL